MNRAIAPRDSRYQCPACGEPVAGTTMTIREVVPGQQALDLGCGHVVTFELLEQVWGIRIAPDARTVKFPPASE